MIKRSNGIEEFFIQNYRFRFIDEIGSGYSSIVYKGTNVISNKIVAIKAVDFSRLDTAEK